ncbi:9651_t:CDS:2 [Paraglomus occultum]|uniref:9651_t:CDS:1 n=1 Tax=Paraglomus occultum TaxID=144539 RepID=A0A9N9CIK2_9GLOM|nr:9651_t:CDS:2 [Paraglomus occultum]
MLLKWQQWNALIQSYCDPMIPHEFKGFAFESYVIRLFMNGDCMLPCKKLGAVKDAMNTNSNNNKKDKSSTKQQSLNEGELKLPSKPYISILLIPTIKNFGTVDFFMTPDYLLQVTIAETHPIKHKQLCNIVNSMQVNHRQLQEDKKIRFYFVVPEDIYDNFQYQKIVTSDNKEVTKLSNNLENVEQWVVKISTTSGTANSNIGI